MEHTPPGVELTHPEQATGGIPSSAPWSTEDQSLSQHEVLHALKIARCILWRAVVTPAAGENPFNWDIHTYNDGAAQQFLPLVRRADGEYVHSWYLSKHPDDRDRMDALSTWAIQTGQPGYTQEFRCLTNNGEYRWLREDVRIEQAGHERWELVGVCMDVTREKDVELALRQALEHNRVLLASLPQRVFFKDRAGTFLSVNKLFADDLGLTSEQVIGKTDFDLFPVELAAKYVADDRAVMDGRQTRVLEERNVVAGQDRTVEVTKAPVVDDSGEVLGVLGLFIDITERKAAQQALVEQARLTALRADVSSTLAQSGSLEAVLQRCTQAMVRHLDATLARVWMLPDGEDYLVLQASSGTVEGLGDKYNRIKLGEHVVGTMAQTREPLLSNALCEHPAIDREWKHREDLVAFAGYPLIVDGRLVGAMALFASRALGEAVVQALATIADGVAQFIQRKQSENLLEYQALHDALTGLPNRNLFHDRLSHAIRSAARKTAPVALLLLDLDRFKEVNDTFGHDAGDRLLRMLKPRLQRVLRECDTIARLGGDEFAIVLPETDREGAVQAANKILEAVDQPFLLDDCRLHVGASLGIALYPEHSHDGHALLRQADVAMYIAKQLGCGHSVYDAGADTYSANRLSLIGELRRAIDTEGLELYYQPRMNLRDGQVTGVEALARWNHPERGLLAPAEFIPLAEHTGLIDSLTAWVIGTALRQLQAWCDAGLNLTVAVNLSARNLQDAGLPGMVERLLKLYDIPGDMLVFEITESAVMADPDRAIATLNALRALGIGISIDDFGTGYSSLAYLKRMPVSEVKIDRSFVKDIPENAEDVTIARSVVDLGHNLGLEVVAEGVETGDSLELLSSIGCDAAQGYYISRPVPADKLTAWLRVRRISKAA